MIIKASLFLLPPPPPPTPQSLPPEGGDSKSDNDDNNDDNDGDSNRNLTPTKRFLLDQSQRTAVSFGTNNAATSVPLQERKSRFSEVFPKANDTFKSDHQPKITDKKEITVSYVQSVIKEF